MNRREMDGSLLDRETLWALVESVPDGLVVTNAEGTITLVNAEAEKLFGYGSGEMISESIEMLVPEASRTAHAKRRTNYVGQPSVRRMGNVLELSGRRKDGTIFPVEVKLSPLGIRNRDGAFIIAIVRDSTELRSIAENRLELAAIVEASSDAIMTTTMDRRVRYWGKGAERLYGYSEQEMLGRSISEIIRPERAFTVDYAYDQIARGENVSFPDSTTLDKEGQPVQVSVAAYPIWNAAGQVVSAGIVHRNIGQQKRLEERFQQAQKMEAIGRLAGGVAHDFNNLLTAILGNADLLKESLSETDPGHANVDEIQQAGDRAASITRQLLVFSRQQVLESSVLDLNELVINLTRILCRLIGENFDLQLSLGQEVGKLWADPVQIDQVIMNLVVNARDAMPEGGRITIETARADIETEQPSAGAELDPGSYVVVKVSDEGCGMDEATRARVFDPFFTTKQAEKGTGLGLATAYGIVKQSGGHINVESTPGRNSTFVVHLPRVPDAVEPEEEATSEETSPGGTETVLLVEDEEGVRRIAHRALIQSGYTVLEAGNGVEARSLAAGHDGPIQLLVTDIVMPRMGGPELAERLMAARSDLKVLLISGYAENLPADGVVAGRTAAFLPKPFTPRTLQRKVREVLDAE